MLPDLLGVYQNSDDLEPVRDVTTKCESDILLVRIKKKQKKSW